MNIALDLIRYTQVLFMLKGIDVLYAEQYVSLICFYTSNSLL